MAAKKTSTRAEKAASGTKKRSTALRPESQKNSSSNELTSSLFCLTLTSF